jgi:hypothetical protein
MVSALGCPRGGGSGQASGGAATTTGIATGTTGGIATSAFMPSPVAQQALRQQVAFQQYLQQQYLQQQATQQAIAIAQLKQQERDRKIALRKEREAAGLAKLEEIRAQNLARRAAQSSVKLASQQ